MRVSGNILSIALATVVLPACCSEPQLSEHNIDKVVKAMTLEEKALLVTGIEMDKGTDIHTAVIGASAQKVAGAAGATHAIQRLGIPSIVFADGPAGLRIAPTREGEDRTYYCTHFPIASLLSSTWNQGLVEQVGESIGNEAAEYGVDVLLAPALNIHRNPLNGRNFEYYSEDPLLSGKIAAAYVRGIQSNGVGTSLKHFAANNQETNRTGVDVRVDERTLREIYLKGYEIAVKEADPWTVMTSYNKINGFYTSEDPHLLQEILRDDWGFRGAVVTDWFGGKDTKAQVVAGNDMLQPGRVSQYEEIISGVKDGSIDAECLDRNVRRILSLIVRTRSFKNCSYGDNPDLAAHAQVTRQSAVEGMVLLENNGALPLSAQDRKVALFGNTSYRFIAGGTGAGNVNRAYTVSLSDGLSNAGLMIDETLRCAYEKAIALADEEAAKAGKEENPFMAELPHPLPADYIPSGKEIAEYAESNDVAIITLGRLSGEFLDRKVSDFNLSASERKLVTDVSRAFRAAGKKTIVVLNVGGVIETASWKDIPDAVLLSWQAGQEGGNSVADILTGKENPSGRLPMTWPVLASDHKSSENFPRAEEDYEFNFDALLGKEIVPGDVKDYDWCNYAEGVYVGYRWFDKAGIEVSYPFGYGLSYTSFSYGEPVLARSGDTISLRVKVNNVGSVAGKDVVELYVAAPGKTMDKPAKELRAFAKTGLIAPGASEEVVLDFNVADLASYNASSASWEVENGCYTVLVGPSCTDIRCSLSFQI